MLQKYLFSTILMVYCAVFSCFAQHNTYRLSDDVSCFPLDISVGKRGAIQIYDESATQLYSPSNSPNSSSMYNSIYLAIGNTVYASNSDAINIEDRNWRGSTSTVSGVSGLGTAASPWVISQTLNRGDYTVVADYNYINGADYFIVDYTVTVPESNTETIKLYHIIDTYLGGADTGPAYTEGVAPYDVVGVNGTSRFIVFAYPTLQWDHFGSHTWSTILDEPAGGADLDDILDFDSNVDNGIGVQWTLGAVKGTQPTFSTRIAFDPSTALPVELLTFNAKVENSTVKIDWQTTSEINNDYFVVERSIDGEIWEELSVIDGAGNSNSSLSYLTRDMNPYPGTSYYRLKQVDFNGDIEVFDPKSVHITYLSIENLFPNPNDGTFKLVLHSKANLKIEQTVFNMDGKCLSRTNKNIVKGKNTIYNNLVALPKGSYYLVLLSNNGEVNERRHFIIH